MLHRNSDRRTVLLGLMSQTLLFAAGCAGYRYGTSSLYRNDIRTIHVPMVRTESFRMNLGPQFTEILQKRIEDRTSFKLSDSTTADSIFVCRIINDTKRVVTETRFDDLVISTSEFPSK